MRPMLRAVLALSLAGGSALGPATAAAAAGSGSVTTAPKAEAWYRAPQACALPSGCPATPPSQYSPDTLHVGVLAGREEARTLLQLDLGAIPPGTKPAGGQLRLPIANGPRDGSRAPETAKLRACLVTEPVEDADGEVGTGPTTDCETASADATYVAAAADAPAAFTVDLTRLAAAWTRSAAPGALALLPAEGTAPTDSWHVAFSDRTRQGDAVARITAAVSFVAVAVDVDQEPPPRVSAPVEAGPFVPPPAFSSTDVFAAQAPAFEAPAALPPVQPEPQATAADPAPQAAPVQAVPVASLVDAGFRYPGVFLLPLVFAVAAGWLGRALTRDLAADPLD